MNLVLALNHQCNLRCRYCYTGQKTDRRVSPEVMDRALDLVFAAPGESLRVAPFGGEPLLEPRLLDRLATEARLRADLTGKTLRLGIVTNGTLLTDRNVDLLERHGFRVTVSLDGDRPAQDCGRVYADGGGSFDAALAGLQRVQKRLGRVGTISVIHPANVDRLPESFEFLRSLGVGGMTFSLDYHAAWSVEDLARLERGLEALIDRLMGAFRSGLGAFVDPFHSKIDSHLSGGFEPGSHCAFGFSGIAVAPSGRIYPCDRLIGEDDEAQADLVIGHVDTGIDQERVRMLESSKNQASPDCEGCPISRRCIWFCGCANHAITGRVGGHSALLCQVEQLYVAAADRLASTLFSELNPAFLRRYYKLKPATAFDI